MYLPSQTLGFVLRFSEERTEWTLERCCWMGQQLRWLRTIERDKQAQQVVARWAKVQARSVQNSKCDGVGFRQDTIVNNCEEDSLPDACSIRQSPRRA